VAELRENHYKMYNFLYGIMPLVRTAVEDITSKKSSRANYTPTNLASSSSGQNLASLFDRALSEFDNSYLRNHLVNVEKQDDSALQEGNQSQVRLDRLKADEFK
jgi:hypothetical protein